MRLIHYRKKGILLFLGYMFILLFIIDISGGNIMSMHTKKSLNEDLFSLIDTFKGSGLAFVSYCMILSLLQIAKKGLENNPFWELVEPTEEMFFEEENLSLPTIADLQAIVQETLDIFMREVKIDVFALARKNGFNDTTFELLKSPSFFAELITEHAELFVYQSYGPPSSELENCVMLFLEHHPNANFQKYGRHICQRVKLKEALNFLLSHSSGLVHETICSALTRTKEVLTATPDGPMMDITIITLSEEDRIRKLKIELENVLFSDT